MLSSAIVASVNTCGFSFAGDDSRDIDALRSYLARCSEVAAVPARDH